MSDKKYTEVYGLSFYGHTNSGTKAREILRYLNSRPQPHRVSREFYRELVNPIKELFENNPDEILKDKFSEPEEIAKELGIRMKIDSMSDGRFVLLSLYSKSEAHELSQKIFKMTRALGISGNVRTANYDGNKIGFGDLWTGASDDMINTKNLATFVAVGMKTARFLVNLEKHIFDELKDISKQEGRSTRYL